MKLKITQVEALLSTRLRITWENGKHAEVERLSADPSPCMLGRGHSPGPDKFPFQLNKGAPRHPPRLIRTH